MARIKIGIRKMPGSEKRAYDGFSSTLFSIRLIRVIRSFSWFLLAKKKAGRKTAGREKQGTENQNGSDNLV
jgi:hypothetical protein